MRIFLVVLWIENSDLRFKKNSHRQPLQNVSRISQKYVFFLQGVFAEAYQELLKTTIVIP